MTSRLFRSLSLSTLAAMPLLIASMATTQNAIANGDTRSIHLLHKHTGEDIYITYKQWGRYDSGALQKLNWFLRDWRKDEPTNMDPRLFDIVWEVYRAVGGSSPIHVVSAYRSASTNAMLRRRSRAVARSSQHILGKAMDYYIPGVSMQAVREVGLRLQRGGVGFYPGSANLFVHMDTGSVRHWPKVSRDYLARIFPDGRTVHIPADGQPMPGYQLALADVQARGGTVSSYGGGEEGEGGGGDGVLMRASNRNGGFFAALFGVRTGAGEAPPPVQPLPRAARGRAVEPPPAPVALAQRIPPPPIPVPTPAAAQPEEAKPQPQKMQIANAPMPRPAPSPQERLQAATTQVALVSAPMPMARPNAAPAIEIAAATPAPAARPGDTGAAEAAALLGARLNGKPQPLPEPTPKTMPTLIATGETRPSAAAQSQPQMMAFASQAAAPIPSPAPPQPRTPPVAAAQQAPVRAEPPPPAVKAEAAPAAKAAPALVQPLVPPSVQGNRGRTLLTQEPSTARPETAMARPNPQQLKLIEQPNAVVAQTFAPMQLTGLPTTRFSGRAIAPVKTVNFSEN